MEKIKWIIDPAHSEIGFKVKHLMITNVKGVFKKFSASVTTEGDDFRNAEIEVDIDAASIDTANEQRDAHLKSPDFFDVAKFNKVYFKGSSFEKTGDGKYTLEGELTIRDITKKINLEVEFGGIVTDPYGNIKAGFGVQGKISRKDFGLLWNGLTETGGVVVSDEVRINCEVQFIKQK